MIGITSRLNKNPLMSQASTSSCTLGCMYFMVYSKKLIEMIITKAKELIGAQGDDCGRVGIINKHND